MCGASIVFLPRKTLMQPDVRQAQSVTGCRSLRNIQASAVPSMTWTQSSQGNSRTGCLEGKRQGDRFTTPEDGVLHSGVNAARNIRDRIKDPDITRFMPFGEVRKVLLRRSSGGALPLKRPELGAYQARQPGADTILCSEMGRFQGTVSGMADQLWRQRLCCALPIAAGRGSGRRGEAPERNWISRFLDPLYRAHAKTRNLS